MKKLALLALTGSLYAGVVQPQKDVSDIVKATEQLTAKYDNNSIKFAMSYSQIQKNHALITKMHEIYSKHISKPTLDKLVKSEKSLIENYKERVGMRLDTLELDKARLRVQRERSIYAESSIPKFLMSYIDKGISFKVKEIEAAQTDIIKQIKKYWFDYVSKNKPPALSPRMMIYLRNYDELNKKK